MNCSEMLKAVEHGEEDIIFLLFHIVPDSKSTGASTGLLEERGTSRSIAFVTQGSSQTIPLLYKPQREKLVVLTKQRHYCWWQEKNIQKSNFHTLK